MVKHLITISLFSVTTFASAQWQQKGLDISGETSGDFSGVSVASSDDASVIAVGAFQADNTGTNAGQSRVFEWNGTAWTQRGVSLEGEAAGDNAGIGIDLNGDGSILAVGAYQNDGNGTDAGHARLFEWDGTNYIQKGNDIEGEFAGDFAGLSVSLNSSGNSVAVGSYYNDNGGFIAGSTRIFDWNGSAWVQKGGSIDGVSFGDNSGFSVCLDSIGETLVVGEWANDDLGGDAGQVRAFIWNGSAWVQKGADLNGLAAGDNTGVSVSMSADGDVIAIGEHRSDENGTDAGRVRIFEWNGSAWVQLGSTLLGVAGGNQFGHSVSLDAAGNTIVIGSDKSDAVDIDAGEVVVFEFAGADWLQKGNVLYGEALGDWFGTFVDITADGNTITVGAPRDDLAGADAGAARIYNYCSGGLNTTVTQNGYDLEAVTGFTTYQWLDCDNNYAPIPGATTELYSGTFNGMFAVEVFDGFCFDTSACFQIAGIGFTDPELVFGIYPNPTIGHIQISLNQVYSDLALEVSDALGRRVHFEQFSQVQDVEISLQQAPGIYYIKLVVAGKEVVEKIILR